ncbi:MAG: tRNA-intron lyase [Thaumarchaeota archaeon]|nr:tRNA-intron lyase [Nitrososphaerota archaeon]
MNGELIENRIIIWDLGESRALFIDGYYGKPIGITKPKPDEIDVPLILDLIEGYYLVEKSRLKIRKARRTIQADEFLEICRREHHNFDKKYTVYKDFRDKGYIVNPGIKFGCDFAVYQKGPGIDHAPYLVQVYNSSDTISATSVVLAGRLATTVRKQFILAIPRGNNVECLALDWWRA